MDSESKAWELAGIEDWMGYDPMTNQMRSLTAASQRCIHEPGCPLCFVDSRGPMVDIDLGPDIDG